MEWYRKDTEEQSFKGAYFLIQLRRDGTTRVECSDTHVTFVPYTLPGQFKETKKYEILTSIAKYKQYAETENSISTNSIN